MYYYSKGYQEGEEPSSRHMMYNGSWGCWGALSHRTSTHKINEIGYYVEEGNAVLAELAKRYEVTPEQAFLMAAQAIVGDYITVRLGEQKVWGTGNSQHNHYLVVFENLHDKLKQRTMWMLFTLRDFMRPKGLKVLVALFDKVGTTTTLREKAIFCNAFYNVTSVLGGDRFGLYITGGSGTPIKAMTVSDLRAILKGKYFEGTAKVGCYAKVKWGDSCTPYRAGFNVQRTALPSLNGRDADLNQDYNSGTQKGNDYRDGIKHHWDTCDGKMAGLSGDVPLAAFVRFVKYYKKY